MCNHSKFHHLRKRWYLIFLIPLFVFGAVAFVMFLWNALLPSIFGLTTITFWQAFGILILSRILFGGFKGPGHKFHHPVHSSHFREKWLNMSEEERQKYKEEWKKCCKTEQE